MLIDLRARGGGGGSKGVTAPQKNLKYYIIRTTNPYRFGQKEFTGSGRIGPRQYGLSQYARARAY